MTPQSSHVWSLAYAGFLSSGALSRAGDGNQTAGDSWVLWRSHRSECWQATVQRGEGTIPVPRPSSSRHTPSPGPRSPPARVRRGQSLSFPSLAAAGWVPGSPVRISGGFPIINRGLGRWAGAGGGQGSGCSNRGPGEEGPLARWG